MGRDLVKVAIGVVWLLLAGGLFLIEPHLQPGSTLSFAAHGKWIALVLGIMNLLRPLASRGVIWLLRRVGLIAPMPKVVEGPPPPKPVVRPDLAFTDDRTQNLPPPGAIQ